MCCGIAKNGGVVGTSVVKIPPIAICNKKIGDDGLSKAEDYNGKLDGYDVENGKETKVEIEFKYPKENFDCMEPPPKPPPKCTPKPDPPVAPVATPCT